MRGAFVCLIFFIIVSHNYSCAAKTSDDYCLLLEDQKLINMSSFEPKECPAEMTNLTTKTLMFDCYNDLFRNCTGDKIIKCSNDTSEASHRKATCVLKKSTVSPEVPELTAENKGTTSIHLLAMSNFNNHSIASYYQLTYNKEGSWEEEVIQVFLEANISSHTNQSSVRFLIENLNSSTVYSIKVEARNNDGYFSVAEINVTTKDVETKDQHYQDLSPGHIAGIVVAVLVVAVLVVIVVVVKVVCVKRKSNEENQRGCSESKDSGTVPEMERMQPSS